MVNILPMIYNKKQWDIFDLLMKYIEDMNISHLYLDSNLYLMYKLRWNKIKVCYKL